MKVRFEEVDPRDLELLEKNARFMRNETFTQLVRNIERDGALTQVPFCVRTDSGKWRVLSGNHRVKAAIAAGLETVPIQVTDESLTQDQQLAIQLSHNSLVGEDNLATLKQLYEDIESVDSKRYAGLDDKTLGLLARIKTEPNPSSSLEWTNVTFTFLPDEVEDIKRVFRLAVETAKGEVFAARLVDYDRFMEAVSLAGGAHDVTNTATSLLLILETFERHLDDLAAGFVAADGSPKHKGMVPVAAAFGALQIKAGTAALVRQALDRARDAEGGDACDASVLIERIVADYLSFEHETASASESAK
jgi:hypothetical protein